MSELTKIRMTDKGRRVFEGPADPEKNPFRYRKCVECGGIIDIIGGEKGILWYPKTDSFHHKQCPDV